MKVKEIMNILEKESINARSAWNKGVAEYAQIILCNFDDEEELNGNIEETPCTLVTAHTHLQSHPATWYRDDHKTERILRQ